MNDFIEFFVRKKFINGIGGDMFFKTIADLLAMIFGLITYIILARALSKEEYSIITQVTAIAMLVAPIVLFKLNSAYCVFLSSVENKAILKSRYVTTLCFVISVIVFLTVIINLGSSWFSALIFGTDKYRSEFFLISLYFGLYSISALSTDFFRCMRQIKKCSLFQILRSAIVTILVVLEIALDNKVSIQTVIIKYCISELIVMIVSSGLLFWIFRKEKVKFEIKPFKEYFQYSLPLMPYLIMAWANNNIGKFILNHQMSLADSAIYSFNYSMISHIFFMQAVVGYTVFPYIAREWNNGNKYAISALLCKGLNIVIVSTLPLIFGTIALAPSIVLILGGINYSVDYFIIIMLCIAFFFNTIYRIYAYLIDVTRKTGWYNFILLITSSINILLNVLLIPRMGIYGTVIVLLIVYIIQALITMIVGTRVGKINLSIDFSCFIRVVISCVVMFLCVHLIYKNSGILNFAISILSGVICYVFSYYILSKLMKKHFI